MTTEYTLGNNKRALTDDEITGYMQIIRDVTASYVGEDFTMYSYFNNRREFITMVTYEIDIPDYVPEMIGTDIDIFLEQLFGPAEEET